jgi:hypothetical protein
MKTLVRTAQGTQLHIRNVPKAAIAQFSIVIRERPGPSMKGDSCPDVAKGCPAAHNIPNGPAANSLCYTMRTGREEAFVAVERTNCKTANSAG